MLLTITCEAEKATDLGHLLHKNPASVFEKQMWFGWARVFYPEATDTRCTAALMIEVDPVGLVRGTGIDARPVRQRPAVRRVEPAERGYRRVVRHGAVGAKQGAPGARRGTDAAPRGDPGDSLPRWRGDDTPPVRTARLHGRGAGARISTPGSPTGARATSTRCR